MIEVTSPSTRKEDLVHKRRIYQDEIKVAEYFLFDPRSEYLNPSLQGHRLSGGRYEPILPVSGRLPSLPRSQFQLAGVGGSAIETSHGRTGISTTC